MIPVAVAVLFLLSSAACGGGGSSNEPGNDLVGLDTGYEAAANEVAVELAADAPTCTAKLTFVDATDDLGKPTASASVFNIAMSYTTARDLKVKVACGTQVVKNASVTFEKINETVQSCQLAAGTVYTDENLSLIHI